jgi:putative acetyltransferase
MIRPYREQDLDRVIAIWAAASATATPFLSEAFLAREEDEIRREWMPRAETWVFQRAGEVVGFIALLGDEVGGLFVDPISQGSGVGRALMDHAASTRQRLVLDVFEQNRIGRRFYERYGFGAIGASTHEATGQRQLRLLFDCRSGAPTAG